MCYIFFLIILGIILYSIFKEESHGSGTGSGNGTGTGSSASGTGTGSGTGSSASGTGSGRVTYTTGTATYSMGTGTNPGTGQQQQQQRPQQGMAANKKKSPTEGLIVYNLKHSPLHEHITVGGTEVKMTLRKPALDPSGAETPTQSLLLRVSCSQKRGGDCLQRPAGLVGRGGDAQRPGVPTRAAQSHGNLRDHLSRNQRHPLGHHACHQLVPGTTASEGLSH